MSVIFALENLYDAVVARFAQEGTFGVAAISPTVFVGTGFNGIILSGNPVEIGSGQITIMTTLGSPSFAGYSWSYGSQSGNGPGSVTPTQLGTTGIYVSFTDPGVATYTPGDITSWTGEPSQAYASNTFGWKEPPRQGGPHKRVIWVPGDDSNDSAGKVGAPKYPGRISPGRPLHTLFELFTVYLITRDPATITNDRAQYHAVRLLFDEWLRAVYLEAFGTFMINSVTWQVGRKEGRYGAGLRVVGEIEAMVQDTEPVPAPVDTMAYIGTQVQSVTESQFIEAS